MSDASGREPGGWELLRAIQSINTRLDDFTKGYVSAEVFALHVERVREIEADLAGEKAEREKADAALRQTAEERRKANAQVWTSIALAAVAVVFSIFGGIVRQELGLP